MPTYAGIPVTHRAYASSVAFVTGHRAVGGEIRWGELARAADTLVILMGLQTLSVIMNRLLVEGCSPDRPVALIESGTLPQQKIAVGTIATIAAMAQQREFCSPTLIVVGEVVNLARELAWFERMSGVDMTTRRNHDAESLGGVSV